MYGKEETEQEVVRRRDERRERKCIVDCMKLSAWRQMLRISRDHTVKSTVPANCQYYHLPCEQPRHIDPALGVSGHMR